jgi:hypothetical protein
VGAYIGGGIKATAGAEAAFNWVILKAGAYVEVRIYIYELLI